MTARAIRKTAGILVVALLAVAGLYYWVTTVEPALSAASNVEESHSVALTPYGPEIVTDAQPDFVISNEPASVYPGPYSEQDNLLLDYLGSDGVSIVPTYGNGDDMVVQAQNICDGLTAGTPVDVIVSTLVNGQGLPAHYGHETASYRYFWTQLDAETMIQAAQDYECGSAPMDNDPAPATA